MTKRSLPAVIVGFERNGLGVSRALAREGIPSIGLSGPQRIPEWSTSTCDVRALKTWSEEALLESLYGIYKEYQEPLPVLITKDQAVTWLSKRRNEVEGWVTLDLPSHEVVDLLMNKRKFGAYATEHDLPMPRTWYFQSDAELRAIQNEITYPAILKPEVKNDAFRRYGSRKAYRLETHTDLERAYEEVAKLEPEVIVQEWVEGPDSNVAFCLSYLSTDVEAYFSGRKIFQYPIHCGNTALCEVAPEKWKHQLQQMTSEIWNGLSYRGLGSVEFKYDRIREKFFIMEPTVGRTNYQNEIAVLNGLNIPAIAYYEAIQESVNAQFLVSAPETSLPHKLVDRGAAFRSVLDYASNNELKLAKGIGIVFGHGQGMLFRIDDVQPFMMMLAMSVYSTIKSLAGRLFRYGRRRS